MGKGGIIVIAKGGKSRFSGLFVWRINRFKPSLSVISRDIPTQPWSPGRDSTNVMTYVAGMTRAAPGTRYVLNAPGRIYFLALPPMHAAAGSSR